MVYRTKMKNILIVVLILIVITTRYVECGKKMTIDELQDYLKPMSKSCKGKTGASEELIQGTKQGNFPRERTLMCYFKCLSVMAKLMNKQGQVTLNSVYKQLDLFVKEELVPNMKAVVEKCFTEVPKTDDSCEYAFDLAACVYNKDPSIFFLP